MGRYRRRNGNKKRSNIRFNKQFSVFRLIMKVVVTTLGIWAGDKVLTIIAGLSKDEASAFIDYYKLMGFGVNETQYIAGNVSNPNPLYNHLVGTIDGTGILSIIGVFAGIWIIMEVVQIRGLNM